MQLEWSQNSEHVQQVRDWRIDLIAAAAVVSPWFHDNVSVTKPIDAILGGSASDVEKELIEIYTKTSTYLLSGTVYPDTAVEVMRMAHALIKRAFGYDIRQREAVGVEKLGDVWRFTDGGWNKMLDEEGIRLILDNQHLLIEELESLARSSYWLENSDSFYIAKQLFKIKLDVNENEALNGVQLHATDTDAAVSVYCSEISNAALAARVVELLNSPDFRHIGREEGEDEYG
jgi:hypothetical protein